MFLWQFARVPYLSYLIQVIVITDKAFVFHCTFYSVRAGTQRVALALYTLCASTASCDWGFQAPEIVGGQGRRGPHV